MKGYDPSRSPTSQEGRDQVKMFVANQKAEEGERWFETWGDVDWDEFKRWVTANIVDNPNRLLGLLRVAEKKRGQYRRPSDVPDLENTLRVAFRQSLNCTSVIKLSTMRPQRDSDAESWATVNMQTLIWPYSEGTIGRISGLMGTGKTNCAGVIAGLWLDVWPTNAIVTNIPFQERAVPEPDGYERRIHIAASLSKTLAYAVNLAEKGRKWIWLFDEIGNAGWLKDQGATNLSKDMGVLIGRNIRKLGGNVVVIDQRAAGFPSIIQEFAEFGAVYECYKPLGLVKVRIVLPNGKPWGKRAINFPRSIIPYETYNQSALDVDFRIPDLLRRVADAGIERKAQLQAMREFLAELNVEVPSSAAAAPVGPIAEGIPSYGDVGSKMSSLADEVEEQLRAKKPPMES